VYGQRLDANHGFVRGHCARLGRTRGCLGGHTCRADARRPARGPLSLLLLHHVHHHHGGICGTLWVLQFPVSGPTASTFCFGQLSGGGMGISHRMCLGLPQYYRGCPMADSPFHWQARRHFSVMDRLRANSVNWTIQILTII
jgi:hypothetical protein